MPEGARLMKGVGNPDTRSNRRRSAFSDAQWLRGPTQAPSGRAASRVGELGTGPSFNVKRRRLKEALHPVQKRVIIQDKGVGRESRLPSTLGAQGKIIVQLL